MSIQDIVLKWDIRCTPIQIYHTAWDINHRYVLKIYDNLTSLERNIVLMKTLHEAGIPVPKIISLPNGADFYEEEASYYLLTTKLSGSHLLDISSLNASWYFRFGEILATLHLAFQKCEGKISYWNNDMLEEMKGWVATNINKCSPDFLKLEDVSHTISELEDSYGILPKQLIHRDVHLGNFLFDGEEFSGYIDFDLSQSNIRIFDLCYFLLGLLLHEDYNQIEEMKWWYFAVNQVIRGYDSRISLSFAEKIAVPCVMKNIELLFVGYFLREGDEKLAKDAADLFYFVKEKEPRIREAIRDVVTWDGIDKSRMSPIKKSGNSKKDKPSSKFQ